MIHLDTHAVVWLYAGLQERFPAVARTMLETEALGISPMVVLELQYLFEIGKVAEPAAPVIADLKDKLGLEVSASPFPEVVMRATALSWTHDPFDRMIAAQSLAEGAPLLTADRTLRRRLPTAFWDRPAAKGPPGTTPRARSGRRGARP